MGWEAPESKGVLFVDGELPGAVLQTWLQEIIEGASKQPIVPLIIKTPDIQKHGMPDLATIEGQEHIERHINDDIKLIVMITSQALSDQAVRMRQNHGDLSRVGS